MKLWIDDLRDPAARTEDGDLVFLPDGEDPATWHWAKTITEAIRLLATWEVVEVSIDHDISHAILPEDGVRSGLVYAPVCCPENYTAVARFIAELPAEFRPRRVVVHAANEAGAQEIMDILRGKVDELQRRRL